MNLKDRFALRRYWNLKNQFCGAFHRYNYDISGLTAPVLFKLTTFENLHHMGKIHFSLLY